MITNACKCGGCGSVEFRGDHGASFHNSFRKYLCPTCGIYGGWIDVTIRVTSLSVLWRPSTWGTESVEEIN